MMMQGSGPVRRKITPATGSPFGGELHSVTGIPPTEPLSVQFDGVPPAAAPTSGRGTTRPGGAPVRPDDNGARNRDRPRLVRAGGDADSGGSDRRRFGRIEEKWSAALHRPDGAGAPTLGQVA